MALPLIEEFDIILGIFLRQHVVLRPVREVLLGALLCLTVRVHLFIPLFPILQAPIANLLPILYVDIPPGLISIEQRHILAILI